MLCPHCVLRCTSRTHSPLLTFHLKAFLLDREAARCTPKTMAHYSYTLGTFVEWLRQHGVNSPEETTAHHIRAYLVHLQRRGLKDTTQHALG